MPNSLNFKPEFNPLSCPSCKKISCECPGGGGSDSKNKENEKKDKSSSESNDDIISMPKMEKEELNILTSLLLKKGLFKILPNARTTSEQKNKPEDEVAQERIFSHECV